MPIHHHSHPVTYCTNIHPGESWAETFAALRRHVPAIKAAVSPRHAFPVGLRLSSRAAAELTGGEELSFRRWLQEQDCYVPTINGFPYGSFHGGRIKERVYRPDWRSRVRADYTIRLAALLAGWLPEGTAGSISTVPLAGQATGAVARDAAIARNLEAALTFLVRINEETGKTILLALEPEPGCLLETTEDVCRFFGDLRLPTGLKNHLGVCYDGCHFAVGFEDPAESLSRLNASGIPIAKVQVSSALRFGGGRASELAGLDEPHYLHQVVVRTHGGGLLRFPDIPDALARRKPRTGDEWRCHFHVPVFQPFFGGIGTTRDFIERLLPLLAGKTLLEVETYTWEILPEADRGRSATESVIRELQWLAEHLYA